MGIDRRSGVGEGESGDRSGVGDEERGGIYRKRSGVEGGESGDGQKEWG